MAQATIAAPAIARARAPRGGPVSNFFKELRRSPSGFVGFILTVLIVGIAVIGPLIVGSDNPVDTNAIWTGPSAAHPLGQDGNGQDILQKIILGGRTIIYVGFGAGALCVAIAVVLGSLAAYFRGWLDDLVLQVTDVVMTVPQIVLLAVIGAFFKLDSPTVLALIIGFLAWPVLMRSIRAQVLSLKEREFVEAAQLLDLGTARIVFAEIVPNMASYILINFIIAVTNSIYALVGLYVLGLAPLAGTNWGIMIYDGNTRGAMFNPDAILYVLSPIAMIVLLQLGLVLLTRSLEEIVNPRLRDR